MRFFDSNYDCYYPGFFSIDMNNSYSLDNMLGSRYESELFHEYIHFLQDATTTYGISNTNVILRKIWDVILYIQNCIKNGQKSIHLPLTSSCFYNDVATNNKEFFNFYNQYTENVIVLKESFLIEIREKTIEEYDSTSLEDININFYELTFKNGYKCNFGAFAIYEGMAHCLQKIIYKKSINEKRNPYDLAYIIWANCLPNYKDDYKSFLDLCEFSLMFYNPAEVFIKTIDDMRKIDYKLGENFFSYLLQNFKIEQNNVVKDLKTLFDEEYKRCYLVINEIFKSDIYSQYREWLLNVLNKGYKDRIEYKPIFSSLLLLQNYKSEERTEWLVRVFQDFGYPPVRNADGIFFFKNAKDINTSISFLSAQAVYSVYHYLHDNEFLGCNLKDTCIEINNCEEFGNLDCEKNPLKLTGTEKLLCPFSIVWKTWGFDKINFERGN